MFTLFAPDLGMYYRRTFHYSQKSGAITMFTESHAKSQNWISSLCVILLLIIPRPIHKITRKFVFQVVPDPKRRCSRPKTEAFQLCSQAVPEVFQKLFQACFPFCSSFFQKLDLFQDKNLHQNYTKITPKLI